MSVIEKIFGTHSDKELKKIYPIVDKIEALGVSRRVRRSMICFRKHLRLSAKPLTVFFI